MSSAAELAKTYDPHQVEDEMYALWEGADAFTAVADDRPPDRRFVVMIPLPNVTGALHLGHAINNTLQDIQVRYHRMLGDNTLWQPGTDHAGIATQAVVERRIFETEGKNRHDLGREEMVRRIWAWKDQYQDRILGQLKKMGCSCDWERTRFTLDEVCAKAVRHTFFKMFKDGLIYRGKRLVNWDTQLQTAVADDEVYHETVKGHFWHFKYPVIPGEPRTSVRADPSSLAEPQFVIIATTRPETMLGDTAVAVNPDPEGALNRLEEKLRAELADARGRDRAEIEARLKRIAERRTTHLPLLITLRDMANEGRKVMLPLVNRPIPLITDEHADPELGTGCVKITPAHDQNDYDVGQRHGLPMVNVLTADGKVAEIIEPDGRKNPNSGRYAGLPFATKGRKKVVGDLEALGLVDYVEDRDIEIGHSDRSKTPIEPYLSDQWFVRMGDVKGGIKLADGTVAPGLAQAAIDAVKDGRVKVFPDRYTKTYLDWLGEKRDWCISRQLWWGHRIPVWRIPNERARRLPAHPRFDDLIHGLKALRDSAGAAHHLWPDPAIHFRAEIAEWVDLTTGFWSPHPDHEADFRELVESFGFEQDPDVLDTWFSSQLWPFSTLGWPDENDSKKYALDYYYPGSVLITSRDIITLWVARMVLGGLYCVGDVPFRHVYIHTKLLDARGETMSKSKGNGVDPVDIIRMYGADALRYSIADLATDTQDVRMPVDYLCPHCQHLTPQTEVVPKNKRPADVSQIKCKSCHEEFATQWADEDVKGKLGVALETSDRFELGRNFANKLWNAARFAFLNLSEPPTSVRADAHQVEGTPYESIGITELPAEDRWILAELSEVVRRTNQQLKTYQFAQCIKDLRSFFWESLCDWYLELTKARLSYEPRTSVRADDPQLEPLPSDDAGVARQILAFVLDQTLRLLHPFMPFITERLWQQLNTIAPRRGLPGLAEPVMGGLLIKAQFPPAEGWPKLDNAGIRAVFADLQAATRGVRDLRSKCGVRPKQKLTVTLNAPAEHLEALRADASIIRRLANVAELTVTTGATRPKNAATLISGHVQILVHDISDDAAEAKRLREEIAETQKQIAASRARLANENFTAKAPADIVQAARERLAELEVTARSLQESWDMLR